MLNKRESSKKRRMQAVGIWLYNNDIIGYITKRPRMIGSISNGWQGNLATCLHYPSYHPTSRGFVDDMIQYYRKNPEAWKRAKSIPRHIALNHDALLTQPRISYVENPYDSPYTYYELTDGTVVWTTKEYRANDLYGSRSYRGWTEYDTDRVEREQETYFDDYVAFETLLWWGVVLITVLVLVVFFIEFSVSITRRSELIK